MNKNLYNITRNPSKAQAATLLEKFIQEKLKGYTEPQRKGTPKGQQIGLSRQKYLASLLMLTNIQQKEIADWIGVSFALIRKWNTEQIFKEEVERHSRDFVESLLKFLKANEETIQKKIVVDKDHTNGHLENVFIRMGDISLYGEGIFMETGRHLAAWARTLADSSTDFRKTRSYYNLMWLLIETEGLPEWERKSIGLFFTKLWLERLREIQSRFRDKREWPEAMHILDLIEWREGGKK